MTITDALVVFAYCDDANHPLYVEARKVLDDHWTVLQKQSATNEERIPDTTRYLGPTSGRMSG